MITHNEIDHALSDVIEFEALVHRLERNNNKTQEDLMEVLRSAVARWDDIMLDVDDNKEGLCDFSDEVLSVIDEQLELAEDSDGDEIAVANLVSVLENIHQKVEYLQENLMGWA